MGAERQVTNVAAGRVSATSTDAINGSQLFATNTAIDVLSTSVSGVTANVNNLGSSAAGALGGGATYNPTTGTISAPSYTTYNADGTTATANDVGSAIDNLNNQGVKYSHTNSTLSDSKALGTDSVAIGPNAVANNAGDVALGNGSVTAAANPTATTTIGGQTYNFAGATPTSVVSVGDVGAERQVTNVAAGRVSATSTDAVNGSQLFATNTAIDVLSTSVSGVTANVNNLGNSAAGALGGGATYNPTTGTISAPSYTTYNADGTTATVNDVGSAIDNLNNQGVKYSHTNSTLPDSKALGTNSVAIGPNAVANNAGDVALGNGSVTAAANPTATTTIGGQTYNFAGTTPTSVVSVGDVGAERQVTNVAAGRVSATSTDAVNGSQLFATNTAIDVLSTSVSNVNANVSNLGNSAAAALGGGATYNPTTGAISLPSYTTYNADGTTATVNDVGTALNNINSQGIRYFHANSTLPDSRALGANSVAIGPNAVATNAGDVALGNGSVTAAANPTATTTIGGQTYNFAGATPTSVVSVGDVGAERQVTNVAAGRVSATSTDAVNGSQLFATNTAIESLSTSTSMGLGSLSTSVTSLSTSTTAGLSALSTSITNLSTTVNNLNGGNSTYYKTNDPSGKPADASGQGAIAGGGGAVASGDHSVALGKNATASGTNSVALGSGSVASEPNTVSIGAPGSERRLTNVAAGVNANDASTVKQVNDAVASGVSQANSYTDQRLANTNQAINDVARHAYSGIAAATALTMIPEVDLGKSIAVGIGSATFQGHAAMAIGVTARLTENLKLKAGVGLSGGGQTYGAGMAYQW
ncbi:hypothetical protein WL43_11575 [Burkholderia ubonensis]|nr:hypothetical protein WL43_11575 [Burkholderia ubonensis]